MRNDILFGWSPYVAFALLVAVPLLRLATPEARRRTLPAVLGEVRRLYFGSAAWRVGIGLVAFGHLLGLLVPHQRRLLRHLPGGPLALQAAAFGLGLLILVSWASLVHERFRPAEGPPMTRSGAATDTLLLTLLALVIGSGMVMTFAYHLGSAWYTVTLAPYLRSLLRFAPDVALVADLPPMVKLHLLSAIAIVAVLPFTAFGAVLVWPLARLERSVSALFGPRARVTS